MSYSFILIADKSGILPTATEILQVLGPVTQYPDGRCQFQSDQDSWIAIERDDATALEYEPEELANIRAKIADPAFYMVYAPFRPVPLASVLVSKLDSRVGWLIDNNHGYIGALAEFQNMISASVEWRTYDGG